MLDEIRTGSFHINSSLEKTTNDIEVCPYHTVSTDRQIA